MNAFTKFPSRRAVLRQSLAGSLLLAFHLPAWAVNEPEQAPDDITGKFAPNAFIRIATDGTTILVMPQVEMGQGVYTSIAMILAEELDAEVRSVPPGWPLCAEFAAAAVDQHSVYGRDPI